MNIDGVYSLWGRQQRLLNERIRKRWRCCTILVGLGGTPFTPTAIRYAVELAQVHEAEVLGITAIDWRRLHAFTHGSNAEAAVRERQRFDAALKQQEQSIEDFVSACTGAGLHHSLARESGDPFEKMISQARYHDLMIFGLRSLFDCDVVGPASSDVLTRLVSRGARPILAVSQEYRPVRRALLDYSGSIESIKAIRRFMQMKLWPDVSVRVVTFEHSPEAANELLTDAAGYCSLSAVSLRIDFLFVQSAMQQRIDMTSFGHSEYYGQQCQEIWRDRFA